jgi:hypothetical protein
MKLTKWQKKLTAAERKHLVKDASCHTLFDVRNLRESQKELEKSLPGTVACWTCRIIARKLGIEAE